MILFLLNIDPEVELLDDMVILFLIFWRTSRFILFSIMIVPTDIPSNCVQGFSFLCIFAIQFSSVQSLSRVRPFATPWTAARRLPYFLIIAILKVWGDISLWFWIVVLQWLVMLSMFSYIYWNRYIFSGKISIQILCSFLIGLFTFIATVVPVPYIFWTLTCYQSYDFLSQTAVSTGSTRTELTAHWQYMAASFKDLQCYSSVVLW